MNPRKAKKWNRKTPTPFVEWISANPGNSPVYTDPLEWCLSLITIHADNLPTTGNSIRRMVRHQKIADRDNLGDLPAHFYISAEGALFQGLPLTHVGSHCYLNNTGNIGVVLLGKFERYIPLAQFKTLEKLVLGLCTNYEIDPTSVHTYDEFDNLEALEGYPKPRPTTRLPKTLPNLSRAVLMLKAKLNEELTGPTEETTSANIAQGTDKKPATFFLSMKGGLAKVSKDFPLDEWVKVDFNLEASG